MFPKSINDTPPTRTPPGHRIGEGHEKPAPAWYRTRWVTPRGSQGFCHAPGYAPPAAPCRTRSRACSHSRSPRMVVLEFCRSAEPLRSRRPSPKNKRLVARYRLSPRIRRRAPHSTTRTLTLYDGRDAEVYADLRNLQLLGNHRLHRSSASRPRQSHCQKLESSKAHCERPRSQKGNVDPRKRAVQSPLKSSHSV